MSPRERIERECAERGRPAVVDGRVALLNGREADPNLIVALGGPPARWVLAGTPGGPAYWLRVWAARGLLWAWDDEALPSIEIVLHDESWRVREMAIRVVARNGLSQMIPAVEGLRDDSVARVRSAASRALARLAAQ